MPDPQDTIFITGGSSGIGAGLARAFHARGAKVIIAGRNPDRLTDIVRQCPGMDTLALDVTDRKSIENCAALLDERYPALNCLINNAGVQRVLDFKSERLPTTEDLDLEIDVNLRGLVHMTNALLPLLRRQAAARIINVGSGLAFVPRTAVPLYAASKAGVHAFTVALRLQLRGTGIRVVELIPPAVDTGLFENSGPTPQRAITVAAFTAQAMRALDSGRSELPIGLARVLQIGARLAPGLMTRLIDRTR